MLVMPAVVICDHRERAVTDFRFPRELRFRYVGHADYFEAQLSMNVRFRQCRKLGSLDAHVRSASLYFHSAMNAGIAEHAGYLCAGRFVERNMRDKSIAEEGRYAQFCPVKKLIRDNKFARPQIFLQRP